MALCCAEHQIVKNVFPRIITAMEEGKRKSRFSPESIAASVRKNFEEEHGSVFDYFSNSIKGFLDEVKTSGEELLPITSTQEDEGEEVYNTFPEYIAAEMFAPMIEMGVITTEEVAGWINNPELRTKLNLTEEDAQVFSSSILPTGIQRYSDNSRREHERLLKLREADDKAFCEKWGSKRIDMMAGYFLKNVRQAQKINQYWGNILTFYKNRLEPELKKQLADPNLKWGEKKKAIEQTLKRVMYIFPSEVEKLDEREQQLGIPYLDTLFKLAVELYKTAEGKDPDDDSVKMGYGMSITLDIAGDPATERRFHRRNALDNLPRYGAKQFGRSTNLLRKGVKYMAPRPVAMGPRR